MSDKPGYKKWVDILAVLIALFSVPTYFYNQHLEAESERRERALEYVNKFQSGDILETRMKLFAKWDNPRMIAVLASGASNENLAKIISDMAKADTAISENLVRLTNFFDSAYACLNSGTCDRETSIGHLASHAGSFCELYGSYIAQLRRSRLLGDTGKGLAKLANLGERPADCNFDV